MIGLVRLRRCAVPSSLRSGMLLGAMAVAFCVLSVPLPSAAQSHTRTNPGTHCGDEGFPDYYLNTMFSYIQPPGWRDSYLRISVGVSPEIAFATNGREFKIWTDVIEPPNLWRTLSGLSKACRLPADPADVVPLLKIKWESANITPSQFAQIHKDLIEALSQYILKAQQRYDQGKQVVFLDSSGYRVRYRNSYEEIEVAVTNDPDEFKPLLDWIDEVKKLFQEKFHRPYEE